MPFALALFLGAAPAHASVTIADYFALADSGQPEHAITEIPAPAEDGTMTIAAPDAGAQPLDLDTLAIPALSSAASNLPPPSTEKSLHKFFCVEYARAISGLHIFGDAKYWWARARNLYARVTLPVEHAVMVFATSARLRRGHVAVVSAIVSKREIRVEQANWQNHGEIDHATPVLDVSARNDWSQVRVWDMRSHTFGGHIYRISGFIAKDPVRQASRD